MASTLGKTAFYAGFEEGLEKSRTRRRENAEAFQKYLDDAVREGRAVSPEELEKYRMSLTGGRTYFEPWLGSQEMLKDMANRTNQRVQSTIIAEATNNLENQKRTEEAFTSLIPIDGNEEQVKAAIFKTVGEQAGTELWAQFGHKFHEYQDRKVNTEVATLMQQPRFATLRTPEEVDIHYGSSSPRVRQLLKEAVAGARAIDTQNRVQAVFTALSALSDPDLVYMDNAALQRQIKLIARANGVELDPDQLAEAMEIARMRQGVANQIDTTRRTRSMHEDLARNDSPLWGLLNGPQGANLRPETILEAINVTAAKHGFRFNSVDEATEALGDLVALTSKIRAGIDYARVTGEIDAAAAANLDALRRENEDGLLRAVKAHKDVKQDDAVWAAIAEVAKDGLVFTFHTPTEVVNEAIEIRKSLGDKPDFRVIKMRLIENLKPSTIDQASDAMRAQMLLQKGIGPPPGQSAVPYFDDFMRGASAVVERIREDLETLPNDQKEGGRWPMEVQQKNALQRRALEARVRQLREISTSMQRANFAEYGNNSRVQHNGRAMSIDEYIATRLQEAENVLDLFDQAVRETIPKGVVQPEIRGLVPGTEPSGRDLNPVGSYWGVNTQSLPSQPRPQTQPQPQQQEREPFFQMDVTRGPPQEQPRRPLFQMNVTRTQPQPQPPQPQPQQPAPPPQPQSPPAPPTERQRVQSRDGAASFIASEEGFRPAPYNDGASGRRSIGYGTEAMPGDENGISEEEARRRMMAEIDSLTDLVREFSKTHRRGWNENQVKALVSFTYNLGRGALYQLTNSGARTDEEIAEKITEYVNEIVDGEKIVRPGLVNRRGREATLFRQPPVRGM